MGRLPLQYVGRDIKFRIPYNLYAEQLFEASSNGNVFPEAALLHNVDKPFEQHRWIIRLTGLDADDNIVEPQPTTLEKRVKLKIQDVSKNENMTKSATLVENLIQLNTGAWDLEEPYTFVRSEGYQVSADVSALPPSCGLDVEDPVCETVILIPVTQVRVQINLQGYLVVVAPPTENR